LRTHIITSHAIHTNHKIEGGDFHASEEEEGHEEKGGRQENHEEEGHEEAEVTFSFQNDETLSNRGRLSFRRMRPDYLFVVLLVCFQSKLACIDFIGDSTRIFP
jgi:hypothetical protein